ncbi:MAG: TetR/AcrR family transcriptional regulator [Sphingomonadaceae bacterium]
MSKNDARRSALIDILADHVLREGLSTASLRPLAKAAGVSDRMLLYYFSDKADLISAIVERIAARLVVILSEARTDTPLPLDALRAELVNILFAEALWPYMRIWLEIASLAARGDPFYRAVGGQMARGFLAWGAAQLASDNPARDAATLLVSIEGILLLKSVGLDDVCAAAV